MCWILRLMIWHDLGEETKLTAEKTLCFLSKGAGIIFGTFSSNSNNKQKHVNLGKMVPSLKRWTNPSNFQGTHVKKKCGFQIHLVMLDETHATTSQTSVPRCVKVMNLCYAVNVKVWWLLTNQISRVCILHRLFDFLFVIWRRSNLKPRSVISVIIKTNP